MLSHVKWRWSWRRIDIDGCMNDTLFSGVSLTMSTFVTKLVTSALRRRSLYARILVICLVILLGWTRRVSHSRIKYRRVVVIFMEQRSEWSVYHTLSRFYIQRSRACMGSIIELHLSKMTAIFLISYRSFGHVNGIFLMPRDWRMIACTIDFWAS